VRPGCRVGCRPGWAGIPWAFGHRRRHAGLLGGVRHIGFAFGIDDVAPDA